MTSDVSVVIATHGESSWQELAWSHAEPSVEAQTVQPDFIVLQHGPTLAEARNAGLRSVRSDWVIFLDADDQLDERYVELMLAAAGDIRVPKLQWTGLTNQAEPFWPAGRRLHVANFIPIGAMVRTADVMAVGGFEEQPVLEDWVVWLKLVGAGATIGWSDAIYRAAQPQSNGRNLSDPQLADRTAQEIRRRFAHKRKAVFV